MKLPKASNRDGFTLIEMLLVLAILSLLASGGLWMSIDCYEDWITRSERDTMLFLLYRSRDESLLQNEPVQLIVASSSYEILENINSQPSDSGDFNRNQSVTITGPSYAVFEGAENMVSSTTFKIQYGNYKSSLTIATDGGISY